MAYAQKKGSEIEWQLDDERARERLVRVRRREPPMSPRVTRKMAKVDARLLAMSRDEVDPMTPTVVPPRLARAVVQPPPLPIPFPFQFSNGSGSSPGLSAANGDDDDSYIHVHDSWLLPPADGPGRFSLRSVLPKADGLGRMNRRSVLPREPEPFTTHPPAFSLPPR